MRKSVASGIVATAEIAMTAGKFESSAAWNDWTPSGTVFISLELTIRNGHTNSSHVAWNMKIGRVTMAGRACGIAIVKNVRKWRAAWTRAASRRSLRHD